MTSLPEEDWCFTAADGFVGKITVSKEFNSLPDNGRFIEPPEILDRITICVIKDKKGDVFVGKSVVIDGKDYDEGVECLKAKQDAKNSMGKRDHFTTNNGWEILGQPFYWENTVYTLLLRGIQNMEHYSTWLKEMVVKNTLVKS